MKKLSVALAIVVALASCKKDNNVHTTSNGNGNTPQSGISPSNDTTYYGFLTFTKMVLVPEPPLQYIAISYSASAAFTSIQQSGSNLSNLQAVGSVALDGTALNFNAANTTYYNNNISDTTCLWQVVGQNGIPTFNYTSTKGFAKYYGYYTFPDTIDHTQALTLPISISNAAKVQVLISDNVHNVIQNVPTGATSITLTAGTLASLSNGNGYIELIGLNDDIENVNGKPMKFEFAYQFRRITYIK